ncbi:MAG TPA: DUF4919 domain-containing protein [Rhizomicrobium sp.]|nr:DUF4919 domain-containing protein [Rhizomicrobium sp.]
MKIAGTLLCLGLLLPATAMADIDGDYAALVAKAQTGDASTDFAALHKAYAQSSSYDPYGQDWQTINNDGYVALQAKDCVTALAKADAVLKIDFTAITSHMLRMTCSKQNGDDATAARELTISKGLLGSILSTGDGKSADTAYMVTTMADERYILLLSRSRETGQALLNTKNGPVDEITATDFVTGGKSTVYFNVSALFAGMERKLQEKAAGATKP